MINILLESVINNNLSMKITRLILLNKEVSMNFLMTPPDFEALIIIPLREQKNYESPY